MSQAERFLCLPEKYSNLMTAKVVLLPVPYEGTITYGAGTANGPKAIIEASSHLEYYDEELDAEQFEIGIHTMPELVLDKRPEAVISTVYDRVRGLLADGKFVVLLGGEHSITVGEVKAYNEHYTDLSILQFDAHADLRDAWGTERHSHACAMRRSYEICPDIVQVGIRSMSAEEKEFVRSNGHEGIIFAHAIKDDGAWIRETVSRLKKNVFITIDLDVFDPSIMPATGTPEPGGMDWYQMTSVLKEVARARNIVGFDIVELAPREGFHSCDFLAAKLAYRLIGYRFFKDRL